MKILITGGAGFVGSNLALKLKSKYPEYTIMCLDNLKRRGSELNLAAFSQQGIKFIHGDIRNNEDLESLERFDLLLDTAAEPSVLAGIDSSISSVINTNLVGTVNCLELARKHNAGFIFLSTSRVYPIEMLERCDWEEQPTRYAWTDNQMIEGISSNGVSEAFPLKGARSFYGTTKLSSELFIEEYQSQTGMNTIINRCGVIAGPRQMGKVDQGFLTLWVARHLWPGRLGYFGYGGEGKQVRDVLHIDDLFRLIDLQVHQMNKFNGEVFNVGGGRDFSVSLHELTQLCQKISGNELSFERVVENREADLRIYITDNSYVKSRLGWEPSLSPTVIVKDVWDWIKENEKLLKPILSNK
ncbi:MAG: CDP-paratose 2-epimerase [Cyclobacteriaceae bacterium]|jgi:CDP-paratose 2-epimerase